MVENSWNGLKRIKTVESGWKGLNVWNAYSSTFQYIPAYSSLFQQIPDHSSQFHPIIVYSSLFQLIKAYYSLLQPVPAYSSQFHPVQAYSSLNCQLFSVNYMSRLLIFCAVFICFKTRVKHILWWKKGHSLYIRYDFC